MWQICFAGYMLDTCWLLLKHYRSSKIEDLSHVLFRTCSWQPFPFYIHYTSWELGSVLLPCGRNCTFFPLQRKWLWTYFPHVSLAVAAQVTSSGTENVLPCPLLCIWKPGMNMCTHSTKHGGRGTHEIEMLLFSSLTWHERKAGLLLFFPGENWGERPLAVWVWQEMFSNNTALVARKC